MVKSMTASPKAVQNFRFRSILGAQLPLLVLEMGMPPSSSAGAAASSYAAMPLTMSTSSSSFKGGKGFGRDL